MHLRLLFTSWVCKVPINPHHTSKTGRHSVHHTQRAQHNTHLLQTNSTQCSYTLLRWRNCRKEMLQMHLCSRDGNRHARCFQACKQPTQLTQLTHYHSNALLIRCTTTHKAQLWPTAPTIHCVPPPSCKQMCHTICLHTTVR